MLKIEGYEIYFTHNNGDWGALFKNIEGHDVTTPYKGSTVCTIKKGEEVIAEGVSFCSMVDRFDKSVGRKISLTRALEKFEKSFRLKVWTEYFRTVSKK